MDISYASNNEEINNKKQFSMWDYPNKQISYMSNNKFEESKEIEFSGGSDDDFNRAENENQDPPEYIDDDEVSFNGMKDLMQNISNWGIPQEMYSKYKNIDLETVQELKLVLRK